MERNRTHIRIWFFLIFILLACLFLLSRTSLGAWLQRIIVGPIDASRENTLLREITFLKTKTIVPSIADTANEKSIDAFVYSFYPNGFKSELMIDRGSDDGISLGDPVLFDNVLLGSVIQVESRRATVRTIFDNNERFAVRVGSNQIDALLVGGIHPRLTLISKNEKIKIGDVVVSATPDFPYGLPIATVKTFEASSRNALGEADLEFAYFPNALRTVRILRIHQ